MKASTNQPDPKPGKLNVLDFVLQDIQSRSDMGKAKYGTRLLTHNGREALWDAYQEALDMVMYLRQALLEQDGATEPVNASDTQSGGDCTCEDFHEIHGLHMFECPKFVCG